MRNVNNFKAKFSIKKEFPENYELNRHIKFLLCIFKAL